MADKECCSSCIKSKEMLEGITGDSKDGLYERVPECGQRSIAQESKVHMEQHPASQE